MDRDIQHAFNNVIENLDATQRGFTILWGIQTLLLLVILWRVW